MPIFIPVNSYTYYMNEINLKKNKQKENKDHRYQIGTQKMLRTVNCTQFRNVTKNVLKLNVKV